MKFLRPLLALGLLVVVTGAVWLWWALPSRVDMADYAPADSIVYVEINDLAGIANAIQSSQVWQATTSGKSASQNQLLTKLGRAGIGPLEGVLFSRAQLVLVVVGLNTSVENETLKVRPDVALIAETHTSSWRTRSATIDAVKKLADLAYGTSTCSEKSADAEYVECSVAGVERKIVGAVAGTLVVLGNSENAVRSCLDVRRGSRPSIRTDAEFMKARSGAMSEQNLAFGYISSANSARLFPLAAPLLMGRVPGDQSLQQLLATSAGKVLRGVTWTASFQEDSIEDRFLFSLEPGVVSLLQPAFEETKLNDQFWTVVPNTFESMTIYGSKEPATAWSSLDSAVALKLDAVTAVLFGSLLKSSLSTYGINNPKEMLASLAPPVLTLRLPDGPEGSVFIAAVRDEKRLKELLVQDSFKENNGQILHQVTADPNPEREFAALFVNGYVVLGKTENMRSFLTALRTKHEGRGPNETWRFSASSKASLNLSLADNPGVIRTFSNDKTRLRNFISTILTIEGRSLSAEESAKLQQAIVDSFFSATETRLSAAGIERRTRSEFGQFGTLISLLQSNASSSVAR